MKELKKLIELRKNLLFLQMEYAVHLVINKGVPFAEAMAQTEVRYFTVGLDETSDAVEAWNGLFTKAESIFELFGPESFAYKSWEKLWSNPIKLKAAIDMENEKAIISESFAGFTYEYHCEYYKEPKPELLTLHFRNAFKPDSPFRHLHELTKGLKQIVEDVQRHRPDILRVQCASWLNNIPAFVGLFPESWMKDSAVAPIEGNSGWWGQFIDREGNFHHNRADLFRKTWTFEWPNRMCTCDLADLKDSCS